MSAAVTGSADLVHNKSGKHKLSISDASPGDVAKWESVFDHLHVTCMAGLCASPCQLVPAADGRLTYDRKKVCYAYQLVAMRKFGPDALSMIPAAKRQDDLVISHLCGTRNCVAERHLIVEAKRINDERTHCHFVLNNLFKRGGPRCGTAGFGSWRVYPHPSMLFGGPQFGMQPHT